MFSVMLCSQPPPPPQVLFFVVTIIIIIIIHIHTLHHKNHNTFDIRSLAFECCNIALVHESLMSH